MQYTQIEAMRQANYVADRARQLLNAPKGNIGRKLRRFLEQVAPNGFLSLLIVRDEEVSVDELKRLAAVALAVHEDCGIVMKPETIAQNLGVCVDQAFGLVQVAFVLALDYKAASVAELLKTVETVYQGFVTVSGLIFQHGRNPFEPSGKFDMGISARGMPSTLVSESAQIAADIISAAMAGEVAF